MTDHSSHWKVAKIWIWRLIAKLIVQHPWLSMSFEKGSGDHGGGLIQVILEHWTFNGHGCSII